MQCHRFESVQFFGDFHGANFGGERGARAANDYNRRYQRAQFPGYRNSHRVGHQMQRTEASQFVRALQRHDDADEKSDERNDRKSFYANGHRLMASPLNTQVAFQRGYECVGKRTAEQLSDATQISECPFDRTADAGERFG